MPNFYDFSKVNNKKEIIVNPEGWVNPLTIEYGTSYYGETISYFWRVKGTKHTFIIPVIRMDYLTEGNYHEHFEEALSSFREDYKIWEKEKWKTSWMQQYREDYSSFIKL